MGIVSIVIGSFALILCWIPIVGLILAILGLIFGISCIAKANKKSSLQEQTILRPEPQQYERPAAYSQENQAVQENQQNYQPQQNYSNQQNYQSQQNQANYSDTSSKDKKTAGIIGIVLSSIALFVALIITLITGLGLALFSASKASLKSSDVSSLSSAVVSAYNSTFENYKGNQAGYLVKSLCSTVVSSNTSNSSNKVSIVYKGVKATSSDEISAMKNKFISSQKYNVDFSYDSAGYINKITITD